MSDRSGSVSASTIGASITGKRRFGASPVWLIPVIAALVCVSLLISSSPSKGPRIFISFQSAEGLEAHKTRVKVKNVVIGEVSAVTLSKDRTGVVATVDLNADARAFTAEDSMFWVVRPRIGAKGVSGVDTLLSGPYIAADSGTSEHPKNTLLVRKAHHPLRLAQKAHVLPCTPRTWAHSMSVLLSIIGAFKSVKWLPVICPRMAKVWMRKFSSMPPTTGL